MKNKKSFIKGFIYLCIVFHNYVAMSLAYLLKISESLLLRILVVISIIFSALLFASSYKKMNSSQRRTTFLLFGLYVFIGLSLLLTYAINSFKRNELIITYLLSFFSNSLSAMLLGLSMIDKRRIDNIEKAFPLFSISFSLILLYSASQNIGKSLVFFTGIDYQNSAYFAAYLLAIALMNCMNIEDRAKNQLLIEKKQYCLNLIIAVMCLFVAFMSGGRGGLVVAFFFVLVFLFYNLKPFLYKKLFLLFIIPLITFFIISEVRGGTLLIGLNRLIGFVPNISSDQSSITRLHLYQEALNIWIQNGILFGPGLGSNVFTLSYYSHNFVMDLLVECGLFGLCSFVYIILKAFKKIKDQKKSGYDYRLLLGLLVMALISLSFSRYWVYEPLLWFSVPAIFIISQAQQTYSIVYTHLMRTENA